jgi:hypothetical protein
MNENNFFYTQEKKMVLCVFNILENIEMNELPLEIYLQEERIEVVEVEQPAEILFTDIVDFGIACSFCDHIEINVWDESKCSVCGNAIDIELFVGDNAFLNFDDL